MIQKLQVIKNLIENKEFSRAYSENNHISKTYRDEIDTIYESIMGLNFGKALLEIDNYIYENSEFLKANETTNQRIEHSNTQSVEERETYEDYNGSYAQEYENLSDQFINDVLEGDPDNYWNID